MPIIRVTEGGDYDPESSSDITPSDVELYSQLIVEMEGRHDYLRWDDFTEEIQANASDGLYFNVSDSNHYWNLSGGDKGDVYVGSRFADTLSGGDGNDVLEGGRSGDTISGGTGLDTLSYEHSSAGVTLDLSVRVHQYSRGTGGDAEGDYVNGIENLIGSKFDDHLTGDKQANALTGGKGADVLDGYIGNDVLSGGNGGDFITGGNGADRMTGGAGADLFVFAGRKDFAGAGTDEITDFSGSTGQGDKLDLTRIADFTVVDHAFDGNGTPELRGVGHRDYLTVSGDIDGDGRADFSLRLDTRVPLTQADLAAPAPAAPLHLDAFAHPGLAGGLHGAEHMAIA